jgi:hypothetical protein
MQGLRKKTLSFRHREKRTEGLPKQVPKTKMSWSGKANISPITAKEDMLLYTCTQMHKINGVPPQDGCPIKMSQPTSNNVSMVCKALHAASNAALN